MVYVLVKSSSVWNGCFVSPSDNSYVFFFFLSAGFRALVVTVLVEAGGFVEIREVVLRASRGDCFLVCRSFFLSLLVRFGKSICGYSVLSACKYICWDRHAEEALDNVEHALYRHNSNMQHV